MAGLVDNEEHLAGYILKLFDNFAKNRQEKQTKWERNREAFKADSEGHWKLKEMKEWETQTFIHATKQKVMAGFALVTDVVMQGGKIPYHYKLSPYSETQLEGLPDEVAEIERENIKDAKALADEQLQMTRSDRAFMKNILSKALYGETVAQFMVKNVTRRRRKPMVIEGIGDLSMVPRNKLQFETVEESRDVPAWGYVSVWDFFYDIEGGIHDGRGNIHRRLVNNHWLRQRMKRPGYITENIKDLLRDSESDNYEFKVDEASLAPSLRNIQNRENNRQYLIFWGRVPKKRIEHFEKELKSRSDSGQARELMDLTDSDERGDDIECCVHVCDGKVVFFAYTRPGDRPYELSYWEDPLDELAGDGVADNVEDMQALLNEMFHDYKRNKKISGNIKGAIKRRMFDNDVKDDDFEKPGVVHELSEDCDNASQAYQPIVVPDVGSSFEPLLNRIIDFLDEDSMIARIMQGGEPSGDVTAKQIMEQTEKGGKYISTVVQNSDERLIEPMMNRFFDYNMDDPENTRGQGDYVAEALGFTSFMDRQVKVKYLAMMLDYVLAHETLAQKYAPEGMFEEMAKFLDTSIDQFERSDDEINEMNQPDPLQEIELQKAQVAIEKDQSATALNQARVQQMGEEGVLKRAKAAEEILARRNG